MGAPYRKSPTFVVKLLLMLELSARRWTVMWQPLAFPITRKEGAPGLISSIYISSLKVVVSVPHLQFVSCFRQLRRFCYF